MNQIEWLINFITTVNSKDYRYSRINYSMRASVSVIIRIKDKNLYDILSSEDEEDEKEESLKISLILDMLEKLNNNGNREVVEILYSKRAANVNDSWSGHVAFPGGRRQEDESELETAIRETKEEIGLNLDDKRKYFYIGRINDNHVTIKGMKNFGVSVFTFLQLEQEPLLLETSEIVDVRYVPVDFFFSKDLFSRIRYISIDSNILDSKLFYILSKYCNVKQIHFPCVDLPVVDNSLDISYTNNKNKNINDITNNDNDSCSYLYNLWGLTLRVTTNLLYLGIGKSDLKPFDLPLFKTKNYYVDTFLFGKKQLKSLNLLSKL